MGDGRRKLDGKGGTFGHNPFANLKKQLSGENPDNAGEAPSPAPQDGTQSGKEDPESSSDPVRGNRLVLHLRRKGQAGKPALQVSGLGGDGSARRKLAREMARAMGLGVRVDGEDLMCPGQDSERLVRWLMERGAREVVKP